MSNPYDPPGREVELATDDFTVDEAARITHYAALNGSLSILVALTTPMCFGSTFFPVQTFWLFTHLMSSLPLVASGAAGVWVVGAWVAARLGRQWIFLERRSDET